MFNFFRCKPSNEEEAHPDTGNSLPGTIIDLKIVVEDEFSFCKQKKKK